jgi:hypothetical protein
MQRTVQIYIKDVDGDFQRIDLFKDEGVSITDKIQDVRDIAKVFTEFSQSFSVPASKNNNKLFKHFYNADIVDGFDARKRAEAYIEINGVTFKEGDIRLEGVNMKHNIADSYRIVFFGKTVTLKDIIGDDELSDLTGLDRYNTIYGTTEIKRGLQRDPDTFATGNPTTITASRLIDSGGIAGSLAGDLVINRTTGATAYVSFKASSTELILSADIFSSTSEEYEVSNHILTPLITHTQRLYYHTNQDIQDTGNLHWHGGGGTHVHGVRWDNLKYALRIHEIIREIQSKYGLTFSNDFFSTTNKAYFNLYMWLHKEKGFIPFPENSALGAPIDAWTPLTRTNSAMINSSTLKIFNGGSVTNLDLIINRSGSDPYFISVTRDGTQVYYESGITSTGTKTIDLTSSVRSYDTNTEYRVIIGGYTSTITFTYFSWEVDSTGVVFTETFTTPSVTLTLDDPFQVTAQIPKMKVMDFLTGLFKMFNLTAFVESDGTIYIDTLDEFYVDKQSSGSPYTIDEYIDSTSHQSNTALPYREITLKYEDTGTLLAKQHEQIEGTVGAWAEEKYVRNALGNQKFDGDLYEVEAPFGHMKFERLYDSADNTLTTIQWGYSADDNFNEDSVNGDYDAYIGKPVLFYPIKNDIEDNGVSEQISFVDSVDSSGEHLDHEALSGTCVMPSNSLYFSTSPSTDNINFKQEVNEYTQTDDFDDTLFEKYYSSYITQTFAQSNRIIKLKAFLPLKILLNYTLADKFIYKGRKHQINSITTNITTGESEIELLNIVIE